jgi:large subunit ribosomal protein L21
MLGTLSYAGPFRASRLEEFRILYAIVEDSGRQFRVKQNDVIDVDLRALPDGAETLEFDRVLLIGDEQEQGSTKIGQPWLEGAKVVARINGELKDDKITVVKFKRRKGYRRKQGHRQRYLRVTITSIMT